MSLDQCHSTVGEKPVKKPRAFSSVQVGVTGKAYHRSLGDVADTAEFRDFLEKEFPSGASRLLESSRRTFLKLMGASVALAGAATLPGCRRPDHKIYPYSKNMPEEVIPGKSLYYATALHLGNGAAEGVIVESYEGRPIKIEGNPLHPANNGKSTALVQASILGLYDPDRLKDPIFADLPGEQGTQARSWEDFAAWSKQHFAQFHASKGAGLAFIVDKKNSPSLEAMRGRIEAAFPKAAWVSYDATQCDEPILGSAAAFGRPVREVLNLEKADVIVSLDRDFLGLNEPGMLKNSRGWSARRQVVSTSDGMSRMYVVEPRYSITGTKADHRLKLNASLIPAFAVLLARELLADGSVANGAGAAALKSAVDAVSIPANVSIDEKFVKAAASDLLKDESGKSRQGKSVIVAGPSQPAAVHALVHALNAVLGNAGQAVSYLPMGEEEAKSSASELAKLSQYLAAGAIDTLVTIGCNPVYDAPADLGFAEKFAKAKTRITLSLDDTDTVAASSWKLPMAHGLESWGDVETPEGTISIQQPLIAPLYAGKSDIEVLAIILGAGVGDVASDGHEIVRGVWRERMGGKDGASGFEQKWRRSLFNGVIETARGSVNADGAAARAVSAVKQLQLAEPPTGDRFEVVFDVGALRDGRFANASWLQEMPDSITKVVWDNVALISQATADKYGLLQDGETVEIRQARMCTIKVNGQSVNVPAWVTPGVADGTVVLTLGYGRKVCGMVGSGVGVNVYPVAGARGSNRRFATGASIERVSSGESAYQIVTTQQHGSMEGRAIVREVDLPAWKKFGDDPFLGMSAEEKQKLVVDPYGHKRELNFAERLGELADTPAVINSYENPQRGTKTDQTAGPGLHTSSSAQNTDTPRLPDFASRPQWGMTIDLTTCTGCNTCTIACQAENNIPVVGKDEVNKHREMHWIRIDRYFSGRTGEKHLGEDAVMHQPVACVHCENAPCETVCPVNATVHGPEGINYMVYNRCIGTRYCANNCPYKVRRFNFFDFGVKRYNGRYIGEDAMKEVGIAPRDVNLIPPRLRERVEEISKLRMNPNVTVRSRGVMEKCTYCLQRINEARVEIKLKNLPGIPDGYFQTACQQACPTDAIVFGDILDTDTAYPLPGGQTRKGSRVSTLRENARAYMLLGYLDTRPRTRHLIEIHNPNEALVDAERKSRWSNPFEEGESGGAGGHAEEKHAAAGGGRPFFDNEKAGEDAGYRMSLGVLSPSSLVARSFGVGVGA